MGIMKENKEEPKQPNDPPSFLEDRISIQSQASWVTVLALALVTALVVGGGVFVFILKA